MKKRFISTTFLIGILLCSASVMAQEAAGQKGTRSGGPRSFIGITGGLSTLGGNFAKGDYADNASGYGGNGGNMGLTGVYFPGHSRFGIAALVSFQSYGFKGAQSLADGYKEGYSLDSTTLSTSGSNHAINVFVGPYYSIAAAKRLSIDVRVLGGLTSVHRAGYHVGFEDADYDITQLESNGTAFGWQFGIAPRYNIGKNLSVMLSVDYFSAKPKFNVEYTSFHPGSGMEEAGVSNQPINKTLPTTYNETIYGINTNLTLCWRL
jgi:hypothetical protein